MADQSPRPIRDVTEELLTVEARMSALGARGAALRAELDARAREVKERDGVAPTWRAKGLGTISFSDPQPKVGVKDPKAFSSWAAQRHPTEVTAILRVPAGHLEEVLALLDGVHTGVDLEIASAWQKEFVDGCAEIDGTVFATDSGEPVEGLMLFPAAPGRLSVRLDAEAKARAAAEMEDPVAAGILASPLGAVAERVITPDRAREIREAAELAAHPELEQADGEPDYDDAPGGVADELARIRSLKVPGLQAECRRLQLPTGGRKAELVARLEQAISDRQPAAVAS